MDLLGLPSFASGLARAGWREGEGGNEEGGADSRGGAEVAGW